MHIKKRVENGKNARASEQRELDTVSAREAKGQREREGERYRGSCANCEPEFR